MATLPNWLYEPLPYVYTTVGAIATLSLDTLVGMLSGILLMSAGIVVWYLRFEHRGQIKAKQERITWLKAQDEKLRREKQAWLRQQAEEFRGKKDPDDDFF
jgi:hypothetical protein